MGAAVLALPAGGVPVGPELFAMVVAGVGEAGAAWAPTTR